MKLAYTGILIALLSLLPGCGEDKSGNNNSASDITSIESIVAEPDRRAIVGRSVSIEEATVTGVVGNYVFWAGDPRNQIPVVRLDKMKGPVSKHVVKDARVRIYGVVRLTEGVSGSDPMWDLINETEKAQIQAATIYIAADTVQVTSP